jgi:hypothetical protein
MGALDPIVPSDVGERHEARRRRRVLLLAASAVVVGLIASIAHSQGPPPPVPPSAAGSASAPAAAGEVPFDHTIHAGKFGIPCLDCHAYADKTPVAGLPSGRKCMGCHKFVAKDDPAVQTLATRFEAGESLRWQRVFYLPDYIYFSHRMHVRAQIECSECHGDIAEMKTVTQERPFTMGRCLSCHEQRHATRACLACHK